MGRFSKICRGDAMLICLGFVCVLSVVIIIACGVIVVREYHLGRNFLPARCSFSRVAPLGDVECTFCTSTTTYTYRGGKLESRTRSRCHKSSYPCVKLHVVYTSNSNHGKKGAVLYSNAVQLTDNHKCSYTVCGALPSENAKKVWNFVKQWQTLGTDGKTASCFYNPGRPWEVIAVKRYSRTSAIHSMVWPALIFVVVGLLLIVGLCQRRKPRPHEDHRHVSRWTPSRIHPQGQVGVRSGQDLPQPTPEVDPPRTAPSVQVVSEPVTPDPLAAPRYSHLEPPVEAPPSYEDAVSKDSREVYV